MGTLTTVIMLSRTHSSSALEKAAFTMSQVFNQPQGSPLTSFLATQHPQREVGDPLDAERMRPGVWGTKYKELPKRLTHSKCKINQVAKMKS